MLYVQKEESRAEKTSEKARKESESAVSLIAYGYFVNGLTCYGLW